MTNPENLNIIFEDNALLVFDKPSGVVVNRSNTHTGFTLQDYVDESTEFIHDPEDDSEFGDRSGIVHRLDKDTSGVIIVAKNTEVFISLQKQFKERSVEKEYCAVVNGLFKDDIVEIDAPIKRNPSNPLKFSIHEEGRVSLTYVEKVKNFKLDDFEFTSLVVKPRTGRTHQIRVHLAACNNAIAGDPIYSTSKQQENAGKYFNRMMLHALSITIIHPDSGVNMVLKSPLPKDFLPYF